MKILILLGTLLLASLAQAQAPVGFTKLTATPVAATTFTDPGCADQTTCYYVVTAQDSAGHESPGANCGAAQLCFNGNQAVAVMPSSGTHTVALSWTASTSTVVGYNVYRAVGPLAPSGLGAVVN